MPVPLPGDPATERARALPVILSLPPQGLPGQTYLYSNLGYIVAGTMLERLAGVRSRTWPRPSCSSPWAWLTAGFGAPVGEAPQGHTAFWLPLPAGFRPLSARRRLPGGAVPPVSARVGPLRHRASGPGATGLSGAGTAGPAASPWAPDLGQFYALGWNVAEGSWGTELRHNGSDGYWSGGSAWCRRWAMAS